jgi:phospholipid/cholesterol/gamma-HCH transport system substrate-binding protein
MSKKAPSTTQLLVIAGFALSCFGILLFLWITFGGPTPFKAKPYEIKIPFNEATQLAQQSDVRISGVTIGKVQKIAVAPNGKQALATIDIEDKYGPIPRGTRAILRTKTLLGETYVELTPGDSSAPALEDGETLPSAQVAESVQLDEIFRTFDVKTRRAFQEWMQYSAAGIQGRGQDFSAGIAELAPTFTEFDKLFRTLDTQQLALRDLFRNGAVALQSLRGRQGDLARLISASNEVFQTTAARERDIEALFRVFPTFEDESRTTLERLKTFALNTDPLVRQLVPAAEQLSPTLISFAKLAPQAKGLFTGLIPVINRASSGFPAFRKLLRDDFPPLLRAVDPLLRNFNPIFKGLDLYKHEVTAALGNVAVAFNAVRASTTGGERIHYLRALGPLGPEGLATFGNRLTYNRNNAYPKPLAGENLAQGLLSFDTRQCSSGIVATLDPETPKDPAFQARASQAEPEKVEERATSLFERLKAIAFAGQESTNVPAPRCELQGPIEPIYGSEGPTTYQHTFEQGG